MPLRSRFLLLLALTGIAQAGLAQNLLVNPELTESSEGWDRSQSTPASAASWDNTRGFPTSGSLVLYQNLPEDTSPSVSQCINIGPQNVDFAAWVKLRYAGGPNYRSVVTYFVFDVPNCSAALIQFRDAAPSGVVIDGWREYRLLNQPLPLETQSIGVYVIFESTGSSAGINVDRLAFGPAGTVPRSEDLFADSFE